MYSRNVKVRSFVDDVGTHGSTTNESSKSGELSTEINLSAYSTMTSLGKKANEVSGSLKAEN
jgi:hypothetical protein